MSLTRCRIGSRGGRGMAADTQGNRVHDVVMTMTVKVGGVTGLAIRAGALADGTADQGTGGGVVTGLTPILVGLTGRGERSRCRHMTVHAERYGVKDMAMGVVREVSTMTYLTSPTTGRHTGGLAISGQQGTIRGVVAGGATIMDFTIDRVDRDATNRTGNA